MTVTMLSFSFETYSGLPDPMQRKGLRIGTGRQITDNDVQGLGVDDLDGVVVAGADQDFVAVFE